MFVCEMTSTNVLIRDNSIYVLSFGTPTIITENGINELDVIRVLMRHIEKY